MCFYLYYVYFQQSTLIVWLHLYRYVLSTPMEDWVIGVVQFLARHKLRDPDIFHSTPETQSIVVNVSDFYVSVIA